MGRAQRLLDEQPPLLHELKYVLRAAGFRCIAASNSVFAYAFGDPSAGVPHVFVLRDDGAFIAPFWWRYVVQVLGLMQLKLRDRSASKDPGKLAPLDPELPVDHAIVVATYNSGCGRDWIAFVPDLPGCVADGTSEQTVAQEARLLVPLWLAAARLAHVNAPSPSPLPSAIKAVERFAEDVTCRVELIATRSVNAEPYPWVLRPEDGSGKPDLAATGFARNDPTLDSQLVTVMPASAGQRVADRRRDRDRLRRYFDAMRALFSPPFNRR